MDSKPNYLRAGIAAALTATAYFYGTGLHPRWYLTWLAPLPILWIAPRSSRRTAWLAAFLAFTAGGANIAVFMTKVAPPAIIALAILAPALLFACFVLIYRRFILRGQLWRAAFTLPTLWVAYEYLNEINSPHSTWGNLAYTQMDCLPILQIASLTGIWSISFLLFLFSSAIAALTAPTSRATKDGVPHPLPSSIGQRVGLEYRASLAIAVALIFIAVLTYGELRLHIAPQGPAVTIGLLNSDPPHTRYQKGPAAIEVIRNFTAHIPALAQQGAQIVVIPEKLIGLDTTNIVAIDQLLSQSARDNRVTIVIGVLHLPNLNESRVYTPDAGLEATYEKHHMLPIFEGDLLPGTTRTLLQEPFGKAGLTICKDMDFPTLSRQYGNDGAGLLLVPAWDFIDDGWQHGRVAILRGVESGFAIARSAKQGILTLTDNRGRVIAEKTTGTSENGFDSLVATLHVHPEPTLYDRFGDWFAWLNLAFAALVLFWPTRRRASAQP
jgi:apolipoprotein N-acyltransferase